MSKAKPVAKQKINVDYEIAWADGWLTYEDETIAEVAGEFNRRNHLKIVIGDPTIAERRLAFFRGSATDPDVLRVELSRFVEGVSEDSQDAAEAAKQPDSGGAI